MILLLAQHPKSKDALEYVNNIASKLNVDISKFHPSLLNIKFR